MKRKGATLEQNSEIAEELLKMLRDGESVSEVLATKARLCEGSAQPKKNKAKKNGKNKGKKKADEHGHGGFRLKPYTREGAMAIVATTGEKKPVLQARRDVKTHTLYFCIVVIPKTTKASKP